MEILFLTFTLGEASAKCNELYKTGWQIKTADVFINTNGLEKVFVMLERHYNPTTASNNTHKFTGGECDR